MSSLMQPLTFFLGNVQYVLVAVVGGLQVSTAGRSRSATCRPSSSTPATSRMPLTQLASMMNVFQSGIALARTGARAARHRRAVTRPDHAGDPGGGRRARRVRRRGVLLRPGRPADRAPLPRRRARPDRRHRRPYRGRQDHARQPPHALLRARRGTHHARRPRHRGDEPARAALVDRHGPPGHVAVRRDDPRQHRLRPPRRDRRGDPHRGPGHVRRPLRAQPARRLRHADQRGGRQHQCRPEAVVDDRPRLPRPAGHPHPRRGHQLGRHVGPRCRSRRR